MRCLDTRLSRRLAQCIPERLLCDRKVDRRPKKSRVHYWSFNLQPARPRAVGALSSLPGGLRRSQRQRAGSPGHARNKAVNSSRWLLRWAISRAVRPAQMPSVPVALRSAPSCSSSRTVSMQPKCTACSKGVDPPVVHGLFRSAPANASAVTTPSWPFFAASHNASDSLSAPSRLTPA